MNEASASFFATGERGIAGCGGFIPLGPGYYRSGINRLIKRKGFSVRVLLEKIVSQAIRDESRESEYWMVVKKKNELMQKLSPERKRAMIDELRAYYAEEMEEELSAFRAEQLLGFMMQCVGPSVYNQAIQDARAFMQERLDDLGAVVYVEE